MFDETFFLYYEETDLCGRAAEAAFVRCSCMHDKFLDAGETSIAAATHLTAFPGGQLSKNMRRYPTMAGAMAGLAAGETMAAMGPLAQLEAGLTDDIAVHTPPLPGFAVGKWTVGTAVHFSYRGLSYSVEDAIYAGIQDGRIEKIFADYGLSFQPPELR